MFRFSSWDIEYNENIPLEGEINDVGNSRYENNNNTKYFSHTNTLNPCDSVIR